MEVGDFSFSTVHGPQTRWAWSPRWRTLGLTGRILSAGRRRLYSLLGTGELKLLFIRCGGAPPCGRPNTGLRLTDELTAVHAAVSAVLAMATFIASYSHFCPETLLWRAPEMVWALQNKGPSYFLNAEASSLSLFRTVYSLLFRTQKSTRFFFPF